MDERIANAVRFVVSAKVAMDDALRDPSLSFLLPTRITNAACSALDASGFVYTVLPFLDLGKEVGCRRVRVPLDQLIGESWRWRELDARGKSAAELVRYLLADARATAGDTDQARVFEIEPFGLFFAHEGKNRVRFLRSQGETHMPAEVTAVAYPEASRLALYELDVVGRQECWCVLDGRWARRLFLPELTVRLLQPYGVALARWPDTLPDASQIAHVLCEPYRRDGSDGPIDLDVIKARVEREDMLRQPVDGSLVEAIFNGVLQPRWRVLAVTALVWTLIWVISMLLPYPHRDDAVMFVLGLCGGALLGSILPWLRIPREASRRFASALWNAER